MMVTTCVSVYIYIKACFSKLVHVVPAQANTHAGCEEPPLPAPSACPSEGDASDTEAAAAEATTKKVAPSSDVASAPLPAGVKQSNTSPLVYTQDFPVFCFFSIYINSCILDTGLN